MFLRHAYCSLDEFPVYIHISYLLLHNKLLQNLDAYHNKHIISHRFFGSGIGEQLRWKVLAQGLSQGCSQGIGRDYSHLKGQQGGSTSKLIHMAVGSLQGLTGSCQRHRFFVTGVAHNMAAGFSHNKHETNKEVITASL